MELLTEKIVILFGMLFATLFFGFIPIKLLGPEATRAAQLRRWDKYISLASCYAGGVFLTACIMDLFPDVREAIDHVLDEIEADYHTKVDYPVTSFIVLFGFFLILTVESTVEMCQNKPLSIDAEAPTERSPLLGDRRAAQDENNDSLFDQEDEAITPAVQVAQSGHGHNHGAPLDVFVHSSFRGLLLLIALSFHSIFEGLALGLQQTVGGLFQVFLAVICHKGIMAFSLGLTLAQSDMSMRSLLSSNVVFSLASPLGMAIGIGLSGIHSLGGDIANGVLQGIACGTFLYIALFEVLFPEFQKPEPNRMLKILAALGGYASISFLLFLTH